jgi:hypothetical protein
MYTLLYAFKLNCQFIVVSHLGTVMDLAEEIANRLKRSNVLLVAPTGWGKTTLMFRLAVKLAKEGWRVGILAPTLTLLVKKWPQLLEILRSEQNPPRAILTAGAGQYCVYRWNIPQRQCPRCRLRHTFGITFDDVVTFEDIERKTPEDKCGYWVQEAISIRYDIIAGHYGRLMKIIAHIHYLFIDEAHEFYLPHITSYPLYDLAELLGVSVEELNNVAVIRELITEKLSRLDLDPVMEDKLYTLSVMLKKTCWIENDVLSCLDIYDMPRGVRIFATTATPPPGWPPEGWGEKIEIKPHIRPRAFAEPEAAFYYREQLRGRWVVLILSLNGFAKSSVYNILPSLPYRRLQHLSIRFPQASSYTRLGASRRLGEDARRRRSRSRCRCCVLAFVAYLRPETPPGREPRSRHRRINSSAFS